MNQNNIDYLIKNLFDFSDQSCFYFFQILDRSKKGNNKNRCIKSYFIDSLESLLAKQEEMITIAEATGSRVYVHPARRRKSDIDLELIAYVANRLVESNNCNKMWRAYESVCGRNKGVETRWIIDVDNKDAQFIANLLIELGIDPIDFILNETVKGVHVITKKKFSLDLFKKKYPNIDVHKNSPTLFYA